MKIRAYHVWVWTAVLVVTGGAVLAAAGMTEMPELHGIGLLILAAAPALLGASAVVGGRLELPEVARHDWEKFRGAGARAAGMVLLLFGGFVFLLGCGKLFAWDMASFGSTGIVLIGLGMAGVLNGVAQISKRIEHKGRPIASFRLLADRAGGVLSLIVGLSMLAAGAIAAVSPETFYALRRTLFEGFLTLSQRALRR